MGKYVRKSREERINEIRLAAMEVFLEKGYYATTLDSIIKATSMTKGGFYNYYHSKDEILADLVRIKNFNYLKTRIDVSGCKTESDLADRLARGFVQHMAEDTAQSRLHLMFAQEFATGNPSFTKIYDEIEEEAISLILSSIRTVFPSFDEEAAKSHLMLLYRINNTLYFIKYIQYSANPSSWKVELDILYELYNHMFTTVIDIGLKKNSRF